MAFFGHIDKSKGSNDLNNIKKKSNLFVSFDKDTSITLFANSTFTISFNLILNQYFKPADHNDRLEQRSQVFI